MRPVPCMHGIFHLYIHVCQELMKKYKCYDNCLENVLFISKTFQSTYFDAWTLMHDI